VITRRCHRDASFYYVEVPADVSGPPYGRAHGYWRKHPKGDLHLTDEEIREFVMVQAVAEHCRLAPADVVRRRSHGESARNINAHRSSKGGDSSPAPRSVASKGSHKEDTAPRLPEGNQAKSPRNSGHGKSAPKK